jgi:hypothetical protein
LALEHASSCLDLAKFQIVNQLGQELVKVESVRLLQDELECTHGVLEFVALECFAFDLVDARQDLLEAVLQIFHALAVDFLNFHTFVGELGSIFAGYSLDGG